LATPKLNLDEALVCVIRRSVWEYSSDFELQYSRNF
jgi:hypothetical protein